MTDPHAESKSEPVSLREAARAIVLDPEAGRGPFTILRGQWEMLRDALAEADARATPPPLSGEQEEEIRAGLEVAERRALTILEGEASIRARQALDALLAAYEDRSEAFERAAADCVRLEGERDEFRELAWDLWTMVVLPHIDKFDTLADPFGVFRRAEVLLDEPIHRPAEAEER